MICDCELCEENEEKLRKDCARKEDECEKVVVREAGEGELVSIYCTDCTTHVPWGPATMLLCTSNYVCSKVKSGEISQMYTLCWAIKPQLWQYSAIIVESLWKYCGNIVKIL